MPEPEESAKPELPPFQLPPLSRDQVRSIDQLAIEQYAMPGICLMENAGRGAAEQIVAFTQAHSIVILCGSGNNGGDGFVIARHLQLLRRKPQILLLSDPGKLSGDALTNWQIVQASQIPCHVVDETSMAAVEETLADAECIVDAMLGTGASGDPRGRIGDAIRIANACESVRVAIDLPSGLDCDSGQLGNPCFRADLTCTFVAPKLGFAAVGANQVTGAVRVVSIGAPADLLKRFASKMSDAH